MFSQETTNNLQIFINSLAVTTTQVLLASKGDEAEMEPVTITYNECQKSQNMVHLLKSKQKLVSEIEIVDINQEIVEAYNFLRSQAGSHGSTFAESNGPKNLREKIYHKHELQKNAGGCSGSTVSQRFFTLPQAYVIRSIVTRRGKQVEKKESQRIYLGDLETVQYLEDSNLLDHIISPSLEDFDMVQSCKYRICRGLPIFRFSKSQGLNSRLAMKKSMSLADRQSLGFSLKGSTDASAPKIQIFCNHQNPFDIPAHQICQFFEQNHFDFELIVSNDVQIRINSHQISIPELMQIV